MKTNQLTLRAEAPEGNRDLISRGVLVRAATVDDKTRSVEVTMSSEEPVTVYDWSIGMIDEVLLADGGVYPEQLPLLDCHSRYALDNVLGAVRNMRREGASWVGRAYFAEGDDIANKAWNKVRQGILTDVSIGYRSTSYVDIPAGQKQTINGREYTANAQRPLRVTSRYEVKELSVVPIGADQKSKIRGEGDPSRTPPGDSGNRKEPVMDWILIRRYLESLGLRSGASEDVMKAFYAGLADAQKTRADAVGNKTMTVEDAVKPAENQRQAPELKPAAGSNATTAAVIATPDQIRAETLRIEKERVRAIREAGQGIDPELVQRALDEDWSTERAGREFLRSMREGRTPSVSADGNSAPGGIVRNHERDCNAATMTIAMVMRSGHTDDARLKIALDMINRQRVRSGEEPLKFDNVMQQAQRYDDMALFDVCRESARIHNVRLPHGRDEMIRSAISGGALTKIFTDSVNANILIAYELEPDTTDFVEEGEVADFKTNTAIRFSAKGGMKKLPRGGKAEHISFEDSGETYKAARYAEQGAVDEQDIIDDSMNAMADVPRQMGEDAAKLRPDLVYYMILANPTMADTGAVYNSTALTMAGGHANYAADAATAVGGPLAAGTLQLAFTSMRKQYLGSGKAKKPINVIPQVLLVPPELQFTAEILIQSAERFKDKEDGSYNPLKGKLRPVVEPRVGTLGVIDPDSGSTATGTAVNYFLFARPGTHAKVVYRRGTNRSPMVRGYVMDKGQYGIGWDIALDIGCKFTDFRGTFMAKGQA